MDADPRPLASWGAILRRCLPFAAGFGLGYFMHFLNRLFLGWWSTDALAAAMPAGFLAWTVQSFFIMSAGYLGTFAAQHHGAGERREAGAMVWPMLVLGGGAAAVSCALIPARHAIVGLFGTEPAVAAQMAELFAWYMAETGPITVAAGISGFMGGIGRTGLLLGMSAATCALSVLLNRWLIFGGAGMPALGITGAGLATLAASLAALATWAALLFAPGMRRDFATWAMRNADPARLLRFCRYALPRGGTEVLEMVGFMAFTAAVTHLGTTALAAHNLVFNLYLVVLVPVIGFVNGITVLVGQAVGAGRIAEARRITRRGFVLCACFIGGVAALFAAVPDLLLAPAAGGHGPGGSWSALADLARPLMLLAAATMLADATQFVFRAGVQGAGDTRWPLAVLTTLAVLLLALPSAAISALAARGAWPAWLGSPLQAVWWVLAGYVWVVAAVMWARWRHGPWPGMSVRA